jgi:hypothetical protein
LKKPKTPPAYYSINTGIATCVLSHCYFSIILYCNSIVFYSNILIQHNTVVMQLKHLIRYLLDPCGLVARSAAPIPPPAVPSGPLGVSPDPPLCPPVLVVSLCPPVLLVSLLIPARVLWCPWCLLGPTMVYHGNSLVRPAAAAPFPGVLLPAVRWLSNLAVAHACIHT